MTCFFITFTFRKVSPLLSYLFFKQPTPVMSIAIHSLNKGKVIENKQKIRRR